ncbi:MAG: response regulator [Lachnospiraceae bacterium]|nr:response regulator [Lachnospiraceae bacterium]
METMGKVVMVGTKESFLIRSTMKKIAEEKVDISFITATVDEINSVYKETDAFILYFDSTHPISAKVLLFLKDKMLEDKKILLMIGEKLDIENAKGHIPEKLVTNAYERPLNQEKFTEDLHAYLHMASYEEKKKSILIVDDDPTYMGLVREWLKESYKVSMANSGMQAITFLGKTPVDLILLDFEMPVVDGPKVLEMLKSDSATNTIPVIFLTGKNDKESVSRVVALKPAGYLLKTISKEDLLQEMEKFFAKQMAKH